jgi:hypothetical protein
MTVYLLDEPFETKVGNVKKPVVVVAYDSETGHFWFGRSNDWHCGSAIVGFFNPPPPIPAAARKPRVGEVWMVRTSEGALAPRMVRIVATDSIYALKSNGDDATCSRLRMGFSMWSGEKYVRPATPEEAEPFRELMEGLMRSLGENGHD